MFVDSPSKAYISNDVLGQNIQSSPLAFRKSSPQECFLLLMKIRAETDSIVHPSIFAILDGQSLQDDTVVLVDMDDNERVKSVRCEFKIACAKLNEYFVGDSGMDEDTEEAESQEVGKPCHGRTSKEVKLGICISTTSATVHDLSQQQNSSFPTPPHSIPVGF